MSKTKREWMPLYSYLDRTAITTHLSDMAAKGWVLEKIGGGGGLTSAGAQFPDKSTDEAAELLVGAIEEYLKENEHKTDN